jgi:hypothetical protein
MLARSSPFVAYQMAVIHLAIVAIAVATACSLANRSFAQSVGAGPQMGPTQGGGNDWPAYQRKSFNNNGPNFGGPGPGYCNWQGGGYGCFPQQFSGNYFQRSYPYHLDYFRVKSNAQNSPPTAGPPNASGGGHWAWCWVPDGTDNTGEIYSAPGTETMPSPVPNQSSAAAPALKPATGTATHTLSLP